jgi:5-methylcytosine-specific restriction enzyme A
MAIREILEKIMAEYPSVSKEAFKKNPFIQYAKTEIPKSINTSLDLPEFYSVKASVGNGSWAKIPWIAILNKLVTENISSGFYCVYLFCADSSGVYLSINQGIAKKRDQYGLGVSRDMIRNQAIRFREKIDPKSIKEFSTEIDLKLNSISKETTARRLGQAYEAGNIFSKLYQKELLPDDHELISDIRKVLEIYYLLFEKSFLKDGFENEIEEEWFEDFSKYRLHRITERNSALSAKVKRLQGYTCKACNFNFESRYGAIGKEYIESHHNVPISSLSKTRIQLDPLSDFTVLCSNCHRMIHRIKPTPMLEEFKKNLK